MSDYNSFLRGSEWSKWDLHVHTPLSIFQRYGGDTKEAWEAYIKDIESLPPEFSVLGINDYFFLDGYERLLKEKSNGRMANIKCLLPVVEFRIEKFAGIDFGSLKRINLHVMFSEELSVETIKSQFLNTLEQSYVLETTGEAWTRAITYASVNELGKTIIENAPADKRSTFSSPLNTGFSNLNIKEDQIFTSLKKDCFKGKYLIAVGKTEWGDLKWTEASVATKKTIINQADVVFTASNGIEDFEKAKIQLKNNAVKDLLLDCSDAHYFSSAPEKDRIGNCNTWIKANPNFEGLKQILYEPDDRVKVQALKPDVKKDRYVISKLSFQDSGKLFGNQVILLNDNLNAIIGGKSSGKSLLLYLMARSIDPSQVERASARLGFDGYTFKENFDFIAEWKNGETDRYADNIRENKIHKITYIPQLYINYLVEKNNKEELNSLIKGILLQDSAFKIRYDEAMGKIKLVNSEIETLINTYLQTRDRALAIQKESTELGKSQSIQKSIDDIDRQISDGQKSSNLSPEEFDDYKKLSNQQQATEKAIAFESTKKETLDSLLSELAANNSELLGSQDSDGFNTRGRIEVLLDEIIDDLSIAELRKDIQTQYQSIIDNLKAKVSQLNIDENINKLRQVLVGINTSLKKYLVKLAGQKELVRLTESLNKEKTRLQQAVSLEKQFSSLLTDYKSTRERIVKLLKQRVEFYELIVNIVNGTKKHIDAEITLEASLIYKVENFVFSEMINKAAISQDSDYHKFFSSKTSVDYNYINDFFIHPLRVNDDKLLYESDKFLPLKQKMSIDGVLRALIKDTMEIDYTVSYKGDNLLEMSPGKKGTVLLILFLEISSAEYPILIDQPEDNLDNRTIYELLCRIIKEKKKERQIIIVSHNANLVVATDTENVIVANQLGQSTNETSSGLRFEYVNGSLEHTSKIDTTIQNVLHQQGIKEHVCDILEGGNKAFKQREKKYAIQ